MSTSRASRRRRGLPEPTHLENDGAGLQRENESTPNIGLGWLKTDQIDEEGAYSILATRVFPAGRKQLHVQDGVLVCHPARILALTGILREQLIRIHKLQLSAQERTAKTSALYDFMTSERCHQIFMQFETLTNELLDLDVAEKKQHETTWRKRGEMLKKAQRNILIQLQGEIDRITGDAAIEQSLPQSQT